MMKIAVDIDGVCAIHGCSGAHLARGLCGMHYKRLERHGNPLAILPRSGGHAHVGSDNPNWAGEGISYKGLHDRLVRVRGKASSHTCVCGEPAHDWAFDEPEGHSTDLSRYAPLCRSCHLLKDRSEA